MTRVEVPAELRARLQAKGQAHVLKFYDEGRLSDEQTAALVRQLEVIDLEQLEAIFRRVSSGHDVADDQTAEIEPVNDADQLDMCSAEQRARWEELGLEAVAHGQVCALVLGGGQGTRLGFAGPKGMYDIGLPSGKTLFQIFAERVVRVQQLAKARFPVGDQYKHVIQFYVMTSAMNHDATVAFFHEHNYFGLAKEQVHYFSQGTLPCLTMDGKLMLESAGKIATASNGNGGIYEALQHSGSLSRLKNEGVKYLHVFSVDNVLCKVADPIFLGYCVDKQADCANKVVWKARPDERVGVVAKKGGKFCVVEYSEIDRAASELVDATTGRLAFGAANICNHFYTLDFLTDVVLPNMNLVYHVAKKKIPIADPTTGETVVPDTNSGIKLEAFIFDVFPLSSRMGVFSVPRETEFAPVKNAPGDPIDSPDTARAMIHAEAKAWLAQAAREASDDEEKVKAFLESLESATQIEISPLVSYNGEALASQVSALLDFPTAEPRSSTLRIE